MRILAALVLAVAVPCLVACGSGEGVAAGPSAEPAAPECNAGRDDGRVGPGRPIELLRRELRAGDRLVAAVDCEPADAVVLELQGPARAGEPGGPAVGDVMTWTEFPRPLPRGVERCPAEGCADGGSAWMSPHLDRRIPVDGPYVLQLRAADGSAACSICVRVEPARP